MKQTTADILLREWSGAEAIYPCDATVSETLDYFALDTKLAPLVQEWSAADAQCRQLAKLFPGLRASTAFNSCRFPYLHTQARIFFDCT